MAGMLELFTANRRVVERLYSHGPRSKGLTPKDLGVKVETLEEMARVGLIKVASIHGPRFVIAREGHALHVTRRAEETGA
jgi:hypothetical protein